MGFNFPKLCYPNFISFSLFLFPHFFFNQGGFLLFYCPETRSKLTFSKGSLIQCFINKETLKVINPAFIYNMTGFIYIRVKIGLWIHEGEKKYNFIMPPMQSEDFPIFTFTIKTRTQKILGKDDNHPSRNF